jgi:undecaprenyl-diphosphatase
MTIIEGIVLGLVQGITEFLPVSSSGHLAILSLIFGIEEGNLFYSVMLHFSTLLAVVIYFREEVIQLIGAFFSLVRRIYKREGNAFEKYERMVLMILIGTIPTGIMGVGLGSVFESLYSQLHYIAIALIITGILLLLSERLAKNKYKIKNFPYANALVIGIFQGFAITPGISRSGATIVGALFMGLDREEAARFSFLLSIPAILGATLLEILSLETGVMLINSGLVIAMILSFVSGLAAISLLMTLIRRGKLYYFSIYVFALAISIWLFMA